MRLAHVIEAVYSRPWFITADAHRSVRMVLDKKLGKGLFEASQEDAGKILSAERVGLFGPVESMRVVGRTAIIPVKGILARGVMPIEKSCGVTDYKDVSMDIREAVNDANIDSIFLDMDSPGGTCNGCHEAYEEILAASAVKPVVAFTEGQMCSACYYLASGAGEIVGTPSSVIGSIGVILQVLDASKAYEGAGYKMHVMRSGPYKAIGVDGDTVTEEQIQHLQETVDRLAGIFKSVVSNHRGITDEGSMDGRVFYGAQDAMNAGLVDRVVNNEQEALAILA